MKGIEDLRRRADEIGAHLHAGLLTTTDENGKPAWVDGREAISIMMDLMRFRHDHDSLSFDALPENLRSQVVLWSRVQLDDNHTHGALIIAIRKWCSKIMGGEKS